MMLAVVVFCFDSLKKAGDSKERNGITTVIHNAIPNLLCLILILRAAPASVGSLHFPRKLGGVSGVNRFTSRERKIIFPCIQ